MNKQFWKGKKVFVTGHSGFKGSWFSLWLENLGSEVFGYSLEPPSEPNLFETVNIAKRITSFKENVTDLNTLKKTIESISPDIIFHFAAQSLVRPSYINPVETYQTNVMGTVNILDVAHNVTSVKTIIIVTSDKCYENKEWLWGYRENEAMGGYDPYSSSKGCAELVTAAYRQSYFSEGEVGVATVRAGNVIGGGDWATDRLIPDAIKGYLKGETLTIRNPQAIRPWQHVLEPLSGYLMLAEALWTAPKKFSGAWNFGPNQSDIQTVQSVIDHLNIMWGHHKTSWKHNNNDEPHEANLLALDCSKAKTLLNWKPKLKLENALELVVSWYKAYYFAEEIEKFTLNQINYYQDME